MLLLKWMLRGQWALILTGLAILGVGVLLVRQPVTPRFQPGDDVLITGPGTLHDKHVSGAEANKIDTPPAQGYGIMLIMGGGFMLLIAPGIASGSEGYRYEKDPRRWEEEFTRRHDRLPGSWDLPKGAKWRR